MGIQVEDTGFDAILVPDKDGLGRRVVFGNMVDFVLQRGVKEVAGPKLVLPDGVAFDGADFGNPGFAALALFGHGLQEFDGVISVFFDV